MADRNEHDWPSDLEPDSECYRCSLRYAEWNDRTDCLR